MSIVNSVEWRIYLRSPRDRVFEFLTTSEGRAKFWATSALEENGIIRFVLADGRKYRAHVIEKIYPDTFALEYFHSLLIFRLSDYGNNHGTDLSLINKNVIEQDFTKVEAGWVSFLMSLKAAADFGVDLRNHDPLKTWDRKYIDS